MKKSAFVLLTVIISAMSPNLTTADEKTHQLNPMVQIELNANMKADLVLTEKMLSIDIKDELASKQKLDVIKRELMRAIPGQILATNATLYTTKQLKIAE